MALYLTYRPKDFSSLVWQGFIKETLQKAVEQDKTVWAYLFTWPRGTGKTSTARIFAKAINCESPQSWNPCGVCIICKNFQDNRLIDIIEIDAASYTGVDNIREIIEKAQFQPTQTKYKIYIIDEVHMLSKGAFNALLKILEEPPKHVKFILATTEIQKVPETILSRCQRFDFRSITDEDIRERLKYIANSESIEVDEKSYTYIVKRAEWGLRNAISLFEQLIHDRKISFEYIVKTLGIGSEDEKEAFLEKILVRESSLLDDFEKYQQQGKNMKIFLKEILTLLLEKTQENLQKGNNVQDFIEVLEILQETLTRTKNSFDEHLTLKIGIVKILAWSKRLSPSSVNPQSVHTWDTKIAVEKGEKIVHPPVDSFSWKIQEIPKQPAHDVLLSAVTDIFAPSESFETPLTTPPVTLPGFDIEAFILQVKLQGAKAAVTMSLRWSDISLQADTLQISAKTNIAQTTLRNVENQNSMFQAGEALHLGFQKIEVL